MPCRRCTGMGCCVDGCKRAAALEQRRAGTMMLPNRLITQAEDRSAPHLGPVGTIAQKVTVLPNKDRRAHAPVGPPSPHRALQEHAAHHVKCPTRAKPQRLCSSLAEEQEVRLSLLSLIPQDRFHGTRVHCMRTRQSPCYDVSSCSRGTLTARVKRQRDPFFPVR